ncbi:unnamed protein product [Acanthocheilonema viteae]|uniref:PDZ domain-containing protein n=1 Tax=Acanthocheilonema viteae TaxID=6277 RepID=A0A498SHQ7_ACAVI|nr:unnamed protein product [Acanthocheilonema viteae]
MIASVFSSKQLSNSSERYSTPFTQPLLISSNSVPITSIFNNVEKKRQHATMCGYIIFVAIVRRKQRIILFGSPANKAGLQVGDCIVEVNGCSAEGKDYAYIVGLIHQMEELAAENFHFDWVWRAGQIDI